MSTRRLTALTMGDRYGIGPELIARVIDRMDPGDAADVVVVGDRRVFDRGCAAIGVASALPSVGDFGAARRVRGPTFLDVAFEAEVGGPGRLSADSGREVRLLFDLLADEVLSGGIAGIVYAPLAKQSMIMSGMAEPDEASLLGTLLGCEAGEMNMLDAVWTSRITSHIPLRDVADSLTTARIGAGIAGMHRFLRSLGIDRPKIAVAALNPHAGEGGAFGREEIDIIAPAVRRVREDGIVAEGPFPADTVFPAAVRDGFHGIVTMYHDQGQIALKALGLGSGVTFLANLPVPIATPGHGTAFDIAGRGIANPSGLINALGVVRSVVRRAEQEIPAQS